MINTQTYINALHQGVSWVLSKMVFTGQMSAVLLLISLTGCVKEFSPDDYGDHTALIVVDAVLNDLQDEQTIKLSLSTPVDNNEYNHLSGCAVTVIDNSGNEYKFIDKGNEYTGIINKNLFVNGSTFMLSFTTPEGHTYESSFDEFTSCPAVDTVYYELNGDKTGVQFYVDIKIEDSYSSYYKWDLIETYENQATWPIGNYYDGEFTYAPPSWDLITCFNTLDIQKIYTLSADNVVSNSTVKNALHFVDNSTQRLFHRYSLLVSQVSLSKDAYEFWEKLKSNSQESGGLFDKQPSNTEGNVKCVTDSDQKVLGFFGVSSIKINRIFIYEVTDLYFPHYFSCTAEHIETEDVLTSEPEEWPIYFAPTPEGYVGFLTGDYECFDCREQGGDTIPPVYWRE